MHYIGKANSTTQHLDIQLPWKKQRCRDGVMSDFVSWCRHLLVPFFFMKWHPYIPLHFIEMIFPLVPLIFLWGFAPRARRFLHAHAHADNAPFLRTRNARVCYGVVQCLPVKSPTIYRRNLRREKNDRLVSVQISIDSGDVW